MLPGNLGYRLHHPFRTTTDDPSIVRRTCIRLLRQYLLEQIRYQAMVPPGTIIGRESQVETGSFEIIQSRHETGATGTVAEGHPLRERPGIDLATIGLLPQMELAKCQKWRLADSTSNHDQSARGRGREAVSEWSPDIQFHSCLLYTSPSPRDRG